MDTNTEVMNAPSMEYTNSTTDLSSNSKDFVIFVLLLVLVFAVLGINIFQIIGKAIEYIISLIKPLFSVIGYTTGSVINTTTDLATDTTKFGIDVVGGSAKDVGNLLISASNNTDLPNYTPIAKTYSSAVFNSLGTTLALHPEMRNNTPTSTDVTIRVPSADSTISPIQNPISSNKQKWCSIGEFQGKTGCVEVDDDSRCLSGQLFATQHLCLNPTKN